MSPKVRLLLSLPLVVFAVISWDFESTRWAAVGVAVYSLPVLLAMLPKPHLWITSAYFSLFLALQSVFSAAFLDEYTTLAPGLDYVLDMHSDAFPGINGPQHVTTDRKGFRVTRPVDYDNRVGPRIFAIGGSTTADIYLGNGKTWTSVLEKKIGDVSKVPVEVINTGVPGLRASQHLATLKRVANWQPDYVVIMMGANDWIRQIVLESNDQHSWKHGVAYRLRPLWLRKSMMGKAFWSARTSMAERLNPASNQAQSRTVEGWDHGSPRDSFSRMDNRNFRPVEVSKEYADFANRIAKYCSDQQVPCVFVTHPSAYQSMVGEEMKPLFWMTPPNENFTVNFESMVHISRLYNKFLTKLGQTYGLHVCDIASRMPPTTEAFYDDMHFNEAGAELFANHLAQCLSRVGY